MGLINSLFTRASINMPSVPLEAAFDLLSSGEKSKTGVHVNGTKSLGLPGFWKGVNLISRAVGKTPIAVKKRSGEIRSFDRTHPAWYLLRKLPSGKNFDVPITAFIFKQIIQAGALIEGNGYAYVLRDTMSAPISLIWLDPKAVVPIKENGKLLYLVTVGNGEIRRVGPMDIIHIKGLSYDGITGYSIIEIMRDSLGLNLAYQINQSVFFRNGMKPGWLIEVPWKFKDQDAVDTFRKKLGNVHQGLERAHIPAILENGASAKPLNISQEDAQFIESREFDLRMLANILMLPSSKLNDVAKVAYNSLEQENQSVLDEAYEPWFIVWEEELEFKLLTEEQKMNDSHEIIFERRRLVQTPFAERIEGYNKGVLSGWLGRDEVRQWEDLNPIPDGSGQKFFVPVNVSAGEKKEEPKPELKPEPKQEEPKGEGEPIEDDKVRKAKEIIVAQIQEAATRLFQRRLFAASKRKSHNAKQFMDWVLDDIYNDNHRAYVELLDPKVKLLRLLEDRSTDTQTETIVAEYLVEMRRGLNQLAGMVDQNSLIMEVDRFMVKHESNVIGFVRTLIEKG